MSVDVYVMPIWKFKAGDFVSPVEALGEALGFPTGTLGPGLLLRRRRRGRVLGKWRAKRATKKLQREIEAELAHPVSWNDQGNVEYADQRHTLEALQAFATWLNYQDLFPTFDPPPEDNYYKHPVMSVQIARPPTFPHLVNHDCYNGYYLPTALERVVHVEPYSIWGNDIFRRSVGSSIRLREELNALSGILGVEGEYACEKDDPLAEVKAAFSQLQKVARISCERDLPIIFHG